jgi:hypothetical protein
MVIRRDGTVVVTGSSSGSVTGDDFLTSCYSAEGKPLWTNLYDGPAHGDDGVAFVAANPAGDVWVMGASARDATNYLPRDIATIRYANNGVPLWTNRYNSAVTNDDYPEALLVDATGNAYVTLNSVQWPLGGLGIIVGYTVIKYSPLGLPVWTNSYSRATSDPALHDIEAVTLALDGDLLVAGRFGGRLPQFGTALLKYDSSGAPVWTNFQSSTVMSLVRSVVVDSHGDIVVTGETSSSNSFPIYVVFKCTADGASVWTNFMTGPIYDGGNVPQTVVDPVGNVYLIGGTAGTSPGLYTILQLSSNGVPVWTNLNADFGTNGAMIECSAVDNAGNLYLTGQAPDPIDDNVRFVTVKYSSSGQAIWTNRLDGVVGLDDFPYALAADNSGNIYVAGQSGDLAGSELTLVKYADLMFYSPPKDFVGSDTISYSVTDNLGNQATGSVLVVVAPGAFRLTVSSPTNFSTTGFRLRVDGAPGTNAIVIEASSDLAHWQPIVTNLPTGGSVQPLDPAAINFPYRFYRAIQQQ